MVYIQLRWGVHKSQGDSQPAGKHGTAVLQSPSVATLVIGVGYVGSRLVQELLYQGRDVVAIDNFFASDRRAVDGFRQVKSFRFVEGSILDPATIGRALDLAADVEVVYLLAAQASAHPDAASADYTEDVNLRGPRRVLDEIVRRGLDVPIVLASSTRVYGSPLPPVVDESTPYGCFTDLAHLSKCYAEKLLELYAAVHHLTCRVVRLGLVYGVAPVLKTDPRFMTAPNLFCLRAARGEPLDVRSADPVATIHVEDATRALLWTGEILDVGGYAVRNAATAVVTIPRIAEEVRRLAESREVTVRINQVRRGPAEVSSLPVLRSRLEQEGFVAQRSLSDGLVETLDHFLVHGQ